MEKLNKLIVFGIFVWILLPGCGISPDEDEGLYYQGKDPLILSKGDTSEVLKFKRISVAGLQGEMHTDEDYTEVSFSYEDSSKIGITERRVIGLAITEPDAQITVYDKSKTYSTDIKVQVVE
ncbi:MAG: hypothetical protein HQK83_07225 [Fibrobacteria bacterium]|nr:hypothetical protein [Fibrobacteria bacterium]